MVQHPDVMPSVAFPYVRGSAAWKRLKIELLAEDNVNIQYTHELKIANCKQAGRKPKEWALELNNLFALLPADQAYSDARKIVMLLSNCDKDLYSFLAGINSGLTYSQLVDRLQSYVEAADTRNTGEDKAENIASVNIALTDRIESLEAQLLEFKTKVNSKSRSGSNSSSSTSYQSSARSKSGNSTKGRRSYQGYQRSNKKVKFANVEPKMSFKCWKCEEPGHLARNCTKEDKKHGNNKQQKKKHRSKKSA